MIGAKDISTNFTEAKRGKIPVNFRDFLQNGDILVKARGENHEAKVFRAQSDDYPYVATSTVLVVRLFNDRYTPLYLAHVINSSKSQKRLRSMSTGRTVASLSPLSMGELQVPDVSLSTQYKIERIMEILDEQRIILTKYYDANERLIKGIQNELIKGVK